MYALVDIGFRWVTFFMLPSHAVNIHIIHHNTQVHIFYTPRPPSIHLKKLNEYNQRYLFD